MSAELVEALDLCRMSAEPVEAGVGITLRQAQDARALCYLIDNLTFRGLTVIIPIEPIRRCIMAYDGKEDEEKDKVGNQDVRYSGFQKESIS